MVGSSGWFPGSAAFVSGARPSRKRARTSWVGNPEPSSTSSVGSITSVDSPLCRISTPGASLSATVTSSESGSVISRLRPAT